MVSVTNHLFPNGPLIAAQQASVAQLKCADDRCSGYPATANQRIQGGSGLIETVAKETFKDLFAPNPVLLTFEDEDRPLAWVAVSEPKIVGVIITSREWVSDLWVVRDHRGQGVGRKLLAQVEAEIAARGPETTGVVQSNAVAVQFYLRQGWQISRKFTLACCRQSFARSRADWLL